MVDGAGHDEQQVGQPVQVDDQNWLDCVRTECDDAAFGPPAYGARLMQQCARTARRRAE